MHYLVTGGAGFIGSHIVDELLLRGHVVTVFDNFSTGRYSNLPLHDNLRIVHGSITDVKALSDICKTSVDGIFHEAALVSVSNSIKDPVFTHDVNTSGTLKVLLAANESGIKNIIMASSCSIYGNSAYGPQDESLPIKPENPYSISKFNDEVFMQTFSKVYGIKTISLRYFNVYGTRQDPNSEYSAVIPKFITSILKHKPPTIYGDGMQTRDFVYVKDIVKANILAMEKAPTGTYNIASGTSTSINDLVKIISEILEISIDPIYKPKRKGDIFESAANISRAKDTFGYLPSYSLHEGLKETVKWYQK